MALYTCVVCATTFNRAPAHAARCPTGPFCSHRCFGVYERGAQNPSWGGGSLPWYCARCGKEGGQAKPSSWHRYKYCSARCRQLTLLTRRQQECPVCLGQFIRESYHQRFCSRTCASRHHREAIRGSANGRFVHGDRQTRYTPGFTATLRRAIVERDDYQCVVCGKEPPEILQVHHLDGSKDNHATTNLVTMCVSCHHRLHNKKIVNAVLMKRWGSRLFAAARRPLQSTT